MVDVFKLIYWVVTTEAVKHLLVDNVLNAQKDGSVIKMVFVLQLVIIVIHGYKVDNVKAVTVVMLYKKDNVFKIQTHLYQALIVYVHNGKVDNV